jgi:hypothetical protein
VYWCEHCLVVAWGLTTPHFMKIRAVGTELLHADERTEKLESNSRFSQFCDRASELPQYHVINLKHL